LNQQQRAIRLSGQVPEADNIPLQMWEAFDLAELLASQGACWTTGFTAEHDARAPFSSAAGCPSLSSNGGLARWRNGVNMLGPTANNAETGGA
jgi:hypothetical protein